MAKRKTAQKPKWPEVVRQDGDLCLTFINTAGRGRKKIETYVDLLAWGRQVRVISTADVRRLERTACERPAAAEAVVEQTRELRACLERIFLAVADGLPPEEADLEALNSGLGAALANRRVLPSRRGGLRLGWGDRGDDDLDRVLWPVTLSAAMLVSSEESSRIRVCAGQDCDLLFIDRSRGSPRKWCNPKTCGHRSRSRKHYHTTVKPRREDRDRRMPATPAEMKEQAIRQTAELRRLKALSQQAAVDAEEPNPGAPEASEPVDLPDAPKAPKPSKGSPF